MAAPAAVGANNPGGETRPNGRIPHRTYQQRTSQNDLNWTFIGGSKVQVLPGLPVWPCGRERGAARGRREVARVAGSIRLIDAAVRRDGDGYGVMLVDVHDLETATALAMRIHERLCEPIELDRETVQVGASIGPYLVEPAERVPSAGRLHDLVDGLMYEAKRAREPLRVARMTELAA